MNIDIHVHTTASPCSRFDPLLLVQGARLEEAPVVITTNHENSHADSPILREKCQELGILYLPALEMTTDWGDFLIFGENLKDFQGKRQIFPTNLLPRSDIAVVWAHPCGYADERYIDSIKEKVSPFIDAVEVINGNLKRRTWSTANKQALRLSQDLKKPGVAGSDAHSAGWYFSTWTEFLEPVSSYADFVRCIKKGLVKLPDMPLHDS